MASDARGRWELFKLISKSWPARFAWFAGAYAWLQLGATELLPDDTANQFPRLYGILTVIPWWSWLLVALALMTVAFFEIGYQTWNETRLYAAKHMELHALIEKKATEMAIRANATETKMPLLNAIAQIERITHFRHALDEAIETRERCWTEIVAAMRNGNWKNDGIHEIEKRRGRGHLISRLEDAFTRVEKAAAPFGEIPPSTLNGEPKVPHDLGQFQSEIHGTYQHAYGLNLTHLNRIQSLRGALMLDREMHGAKMTVVAYLQGKNE